MPFQNNATFLENIILVTIASYILDETELDFVNSFAMPPLSPWKKDHHKNIITTNIAISPNFLSKLKNINLYKKIDYPFLLQLCLKNYANLGPNGALLLTLLSELKNRKVRMWLNDMPNGRYGNTISKLRHMNAIVKKILKRKPIYAKEIRTSGIKYPHSLNRLRMVLKEWSSSKDKDAAIIGYLDPWYYRNTSRRTDTTSSQDHRQWLKLIASMNYSLSISVHLTVNTNRKKLKQELQHMYEDGIEFGFYKNITFLLDYFAVSVSIYDKTVGSNISNEIYDGITDSLKSYSTLNNDFSFKNINIITHEISK